MYSFKDFILNEVSQKVLDVAIARFIKAGADEEEVKGIVSTFNDLSTKNRMTGVNIQSISFEDLQKIVKEKSETSKTQVKKEKAEDDIKGAEKVVDNQYANVWLINNHKASCLIGLGADWCTVNKAPDYFNQYKKSHEIYYIIPKKDFVMRKIKTKNGVKELKLPNKFTMLIDMNGEVNPHEIRNLDNDEMSVEWLMKRLKDLHIEL